MKKGSLNFLGRKNQSLFDNNIKMKEMDNLELMLDSSAIPESGTASVKSRPTVKHYASSSDLVQGFAVPTPTVPVLPTANRPQINMNMNGDWMSNGSARSIPDLLDGGMFIPPPPSMAPPPPPTKFLPPTPDFLGDTVSFQLPPMAPPKPPSKQQSVARPEDPSLRPPSMPTPKPPSTTSSASSHLPNNTSPPTSVPDFTERPKFAPPQPPADMRQVALKALKNPPLKPVRLSSMASVDEPQGPAPTPPVKKPTPSSFNPQNTAKIYSVPKTGIPGKQTDQENRPKQILLLHDPKLTESGPVQVNRNPPAVAPPSKPARKNSFGLQLESKENLQAAWSGQATPAKTNEEVKVEPLPPSTEQVIPKPTNPPPEEPPKHQNVVTAPVTMDTSQIKHDVSSGQSHKFSPMLDRKLRSLKTSDVPATRKGPAASPLALLMAAKEREKHRFATSHEHKTTSNEPSTSIQHSESNPNSFTVNPRSTPFSSQEKPPSEVSVEPRLVIQAPSKPTESVVSQGAVPTSKFSSSSYPAMDTSGQQRIPPASSHAREQDKKEDQCMPLLAPPPEFDDNVTDSPPSSPPPDPPLKQVLPPTASPVVFVMPQTPSHAPPVMPPTPKFAPPVMPPTPRFAPPVMPPASDLKTNIPPPAPPTVKPKPPSPPKFPSPVTEVKTKLPVQANPKPPPTQAPSSLSANQATLLSILQKKMLEMDNKMDKKMLVMKDTECDDWESPLSDEETKVTFGVTKKPPVITPATPVAKTQGLDMKELESKMKAHGSSTSSKGLTSNGAQSKQASGITFTVRPGTKQPITVLNKGDSS